MMSLQRNVRRIFVATCRTSNSHAQSRPPPQHPSPFVVAVARHRYHVDSFRFPRHKTMTQQHQPPPPPPHLVYSFPMRSFATRRRRYQPSHSKGKSPEYWEKEYIKSKEHLDAMNKNKLQLEEPKQLNDIISWRVLLIMAISPLVLCMIIPDLRDKMFDSFSTPTSTSSLSSSDDGRHPNKK